MKKCIRKQRHILTALPSISTYAFQGMTQHHGMCSTTPTNMSLLDHVMTLTV